jgi:DNA-binding transcriptional regulator YiaG
VLLSVVHVVLQFKTFDEFDAAFQDVPWTNPQMDCLDAILRANNWQISGLRGSGNVVVLDRLPAAPTVSPLHCLPEGRDEQDPEPDDTPQEASAAPPASLDTAVPHTPLAEPTDMTTTTTTTTATTAAQPRDAATTRSLTREKEEEVARDLKRFLRHSPKSSANVHLFAGALHMLRSASDMSTTDLASLLGLSNSVVRKWETGVIYPSARSFRRMAEVWPVLDELFDATVFRNSNAKLAEPTEDDPQPTEAAAPIPPPPAPAPTPPKQTPVSTVAPPLDRVAFLNTIRYAVQHARGDSSGLHSLLAMSASRGILVQDLLNALEGKEP